MIIKKFEFDTFRHKAAHSIDHAMLLDSPEIIEWRKKFIKAIRAYRRAGRQIFYLDESYIHQFHMNGKVWVDTTVTSAADANEKGLSTGIKIPAGKGKRLIIIGMGSIDGWLEGSLGCWKRSTKKGPLPADYHLVCSICLE